MIANLNRLLNRIRKIDQEMDDAQSDRDFHDQLFAGQHPPPFAFSYFGYLTIKRFADLAAPYVENTKSVLDLGCGPAEITCELARRFPQVSFLGVDHSPNGDRSGRKATPNPCSLEISSSRSRPSRSSCPG